ncbi:MAG TPA: tetratricopeptide repeat protein, partial [Polyangiales bacterium]|nr:tetratricopeptide repeat protein [Polyangiales bacterium]
LKAQRSFLDGNFAEAERRWAEARTRAARGGLVYAELFYNTQVFNFALERDGAAAVLTRRFGNAAFNSATPSTRANAARVDAEAGQIERARGELSSLGDPTDYPRDGHYLNLLANMAACAALVDDKAHCEQLFALLSPYAALNTPSPMGFYLGSVAHFLGMLSVALGKPAQAAEHFEHALERNRAMGYRAGTVRTLLAHARLTEQQGNRPAARDLFETARREAEALGMRWAVADAEARLAGA